MTTTQSQIPKEQGPKKIHPKPASKHAFFKCPTTPPGTNAIPTKPGDRKRRNIQHLPRTSLSPVTKPSYKPGRQPITQFSLFLAVAFFCHRPSLFSLSTFLIVTFSHYLLPPRGYPIPKSMLSPNFYLLRPAGPDEKKETVRAPEN